MVELSKSILLINSYGEFCEMVVPLRSEYSRLIRNRYPTSYGCEISYDTRRTVSQLLKAIIEAESVAEHSRKILNTNYGFSTYECFEIIKGRYKSYVLKDDVRFDII
jgi:hypothetical protein